jgi:hypothetical protein
MGAGKPRDFDDAKFVPMPSLFRFLTVIGVLAVVVYGAMYALANWFDPKPREITVSIPPDKFSKQH